MNALREGMEHMDTDKTVVRPLVAPRVLAPNPFLLPRSTMDPPAPWLRRAPRAGSKRRTLLLVTSLLAFVVAIVLHASPVARARARVAGAGVAKTIATHAVMLVRGEP